MAVGTINIGKTEFTFVFRHRWEKYDNNAEKRLSNSVMWSEWKLGLFFRKYKVVAKKNFKTPKKWQFVNEYMFGINLLVCKGMDDCSTSGMVMNIDI